MRTEEFNHIILPMRSDLKAYALRLTESDDNAEDLVQEVMLSCGTCARISRQKITSRRSPSPSCATSFMTSAGMRSGTSPPTG
ncbi:hypothetical protein DW064_12295 [Segatella copri]|uniref:Uncharacterized protein n=1 Tax=Segatella copri TaxID=165179 RepID=A0AA93BLQ5_9BACT|nr:hypothetical protein DW064_12295 [Segatella copri]